jgi:hypothetical protein|tara:strand:- start:935 stop:1570 length:636 start_codon:yes stop_codon:yes gene_type:complete
MSSIDNLKSLISKKGGLAPANRFNVIFTPPSQSLLNLDPQAILGSIISGNFNAKNLINDPRDISILCQSVTLPGRSISTFDHQDYKQSNKFPYTFIDEDVTISFLLTNDYYMRKMFDSWQSNIFNSESYIAGYKSNYSVDVIIQQLDQQNTPVYGVKLEKAYPVSFDSIELSQDATDTIKMSVTFAYDKYVPEGPLSSTGSAIRSALDIFG